MEALKYIVGLSITGSMMFFIFLIMRPITGRIFSNSWHYKACIIILIFFILPVGTFIQTPFSTSAQLFNDVSATTNTDNIIPAKGIEEVSNVNERQITEKSDGKVIADESPAIHTDGVDESEVYRFNFDERLILPVWLIGMTALFLIKIIPYLKFKNAVLKSSMEICDNSVLELFNICRDRINIRKSVSLRVCESISSPMLTGIFNPVVLLPSVDEDAETLRMIFMHELTHYRQKDILVKFSGVLVNIVHWFNPLVYLLMKKINIFCEYSADEKVAGKMENEERKYYCGTILKLVDDSVRGGRAFTTAMSSGGKELKSRLENIMFFKKESKKGYIKSILALILVVISGFIVSGSVLQAKNSPDNDPFIVYTKDDGLYFNYLSSGEEVKIQEGEAFSNPTISKSGEYIAYTNDGSLYVYDIKNSEYERITGDIRSYDWINGESLVYSTTENGFYKFNFKKNETVRQNDEFYYDNFNAADENTVYGRRTYSVNEDGRELVLPDGIVEINLNEYDAGTGSFSSTVIIESRMPADNAMGYDPMIWDVTDDGRYVFIKETFMSASLSADIGGIGVYDTENKTHTDLTGIYEADNNASGENLIVVPRNDNLALNPVNNNITGVIKGEGRDIITNKKAALLEINEDKTYRETEITDENLTAMTPDFTADGKKLLYSATTDIDPTSYRDNIGNIDYRIIIDNWMKQPHNIYEYDIETSEIKKLTNGESFDLMPVSISEDTVIFLRHKGSGDNNFSLMKITKGKEELIAENITYGDYLGYTEKSMDIFR